eukprot:TRINITY_DN2376_c0_g1_i4.p1 TRINITY_DN2376_c0_g1~~TRINITY_DN2376_c0_g1_i4.p1  ORF type:complete len:149 (-),score=27.98 TRINITY_DN2376_c0_g1_i4:377-823(-)
MDDLDLPAPPVSRRAKKLEPRTLPLKAVTISLHCWKIGFLGVLAWALVNFINYRLKAPEIEAKLSRDTEFWNFCVANYRSRDLNRLLQRLQIQGFLLPRQSQRLKMDLVIMRPSKQRPLMMAMATSLHSPLKSSCLHSRSLLGWNRLV